MYLPSHTTPIYIHHKAHESPKNGIHVLCHNFYLLYSSPNVIPSFLQSPLVGLLLPQFGSPHHCERKRNVKLNVSVVQIYIQDTSQTTTQVFPPRSIPSTDESSTRIRSIAHGNPRPGKMAGPKSIKDRLSLIPPAPEPQSRLGCPFWRNETGAVVLGVVLDRHAGPNQLV